MLDDRDIQKLSDVFVTKAEHKELKDTTVRIAEMVTKHDIQLDRLEKKVENIETATKAILTAVDKISKSVDDLRHEYIAIKLQLDRHEKWIKEIAEKTGVALSPA
ncbi:hypothetical protein HY416_01100 [Candidatus Kaiserbacteria bacterium]|nr:hypothetical protein [Candidatus Kaiserbacteria bacterium]